MSRAAPGRTDRPAPRDLYGIGPVGSWVGPILALVGLLVVGWFTLRLLTGDLPVPSAGDGRDPGAPGQPGGHRTPAPSNVVVVDPRADVPGSIVYVKSGNVWIQSGTNARQLTTSGRATHPSWAPDGKSIVYIESTDEIGEFPARGRARRYEMPVPTIMRVSADGRGEPEAVADGRVEIAGYSWFHWLRQPVLSPDGETLAVMSDGPDPQRSNVVAQLMDLETGEFSRPDIPETAPLGHQDPAWRPDGRLLLVVRNDRDGTGARGAPVIWRWNPDTGNASALSGPGYLAPSWSRDQRWIAATRTTSLGTDVVVLDAQTGAEVTRVTDDGRSFSPVWSPTMDAIAYLHESGGIIDLRLAKLTGSAPNWRVTEIIALTDVSGLEARSRPDWFIPPEDLPPLPTRGPASPSAGASPGQGSASP